MAAGHGHRAAAGDYLSYGILNYGLLDYRPADFLSVFGLYLISHGLFTWSSRLAYNRGAKTEAGVINHLDRRRNIFFNGGYFSAGAQDKNLQVGANWRFRRRLQSVAVLQFYLFFLD